MRIDISQLLDDPVVLPQPHCVQPREARLLVDPIRLRAVNFPQIQQDFKVFQAFRIHKMILKCSCCLNNNCSTETVLKVASFFKCLPAVSGVEAVEVAAGDAALLLGEVRLERRQQRLADVQVGVPQHAVLEEPAERYEK